MKLKDLTIIISNKKGDRYQVGLSKIEKENVINYLEYLHKGRIKILRGKLSMKLIKGGDKSG